MLSSVSTNSFRRATYSKGSLCFYHSARAVIRFSFVDKPQPAAIDDVAHAGCINDKRRPFRADNAFAAPVANRIASHTAQVGRGEAVSEIMIAHQYFPRFQSARFAASSCVKPTARLLDLTQSPNPGTAITSSANELGGAGARLWVVQPPAQR